MASGVRLCAFYDASIFTWDVFLTLGNLVQSSRPVGKATPQGHPGCGGYWPEYRPPQEGDIARMLNKNYNRDTFDLEELNLHNGIEHDASLTRLDTSLQPNQSVPHPALIEELLSFATGKNAVGNPLLTNKDLSRILGKRRAESKATNKEYSLRFAHRLFGSSNASTMLTIFGGRVDDLRVMLLEERLPAGWESRVRKHYGLTILTLNSVVFPVEFGIREADYLLGDLRVHCSFGLLPMESRTDTLVGI
ncbi:hypothetical protein HD554DRAFT_2204878 [Boletus coccyginus]|nr:hypothetical protein HD554DRAFT_2204878 [Boletus coccyginus]